MIPIFFTLQIFQDPAEPGAIDLIKKQDGSINYVVIILSIIFSFTSWGKDAGKLKITKLGSAILVKVIALLFPFGTWIMSLMAHPLSDGQGPRYDPPGDIHGRQISDGHLGENFNLLPFLVRLAGFSIILVFAYIFSNAKKAKSGGTETRGPIH